MIEIPGRIPIRIHPIFWVLILGIGFISSFSLIGTVLWAIVILVSLLVHEFGHALTARAFGQEARISLVAFGGVTERQGPPTKLWQDFLIVLDGPLAGLSLFFIAYLIQQQIPEKTSGIPIVMLWMFLYVNLFWTVLNLLPVQPLDGGHLLRILFEGVFGFRGIRYALLVSTIIATVACFFFFSIRFVFAGVIFLLLGVENFRAWRSVQTMTEEDYHHPLGADLERAGESLQGGNVQEAEVLFRKVYEGSNGGVVHAEAAKGLALVLAHQGKVEEPYHLLITCKKQLDGESLILMHSLAYRMRDWALVKEIGKKAYQVKPSGETAVANALASAHYRDASAAIGWLQCAINEGVENMATLLSSEAFDPIRESKVFQTFVLKTTTS